MYNSTILDHGLIRDKPKIIKYFQSFSRKKKTKGNGALLTLFGQKNKIENFFFAVLNVLKFSLLPPYLLIHYLKLINS